MDAKLYIILLTYAAEVGNERAQYAETTLRSALDNLHYSGPISVHIADDGSPEAHRQMLVDIAGGYEKVQGVTTSNANRAGYGASYNLATQTVHTWADVVLPLEDDWELREPLNVDGMVGALMTSPVQCIRLGYLGFTQPLAGELMHFCDSTYLVFNPDSPEHHICAGHPRLESVRFEHTVGPWAEGLNPGDTERDWCGRRGASEWVAWPMGQPLDGYFKHIGAVQAREDQR